MNVVSSSQPTEGQIIKCWMLRGCSAARRGQNIRRGHLNVNEGSGWLGLGNDCHNSGELLQLVLTRIGQSYIVTKILCYEGSRDDVLALCKMTSSEEVVAIKVLC